ncbi:BON domain-containing protein [Halioglobus pacificus]|uniref:BON domain-containing protein n=1 Tax=Parahalioglobus pacificus TaxID=930806 RepID=A0A918XDA0_9GAMM|nr:BON domain-containing protein [Halioglobus pacificus]GHD25908.1 BON domain-containing protein [Halioglobus pacificus]
MFMSRLVSLLVISLMLSGCGSILASFESNAIEDDPGERNLSQQIADESVETKAIVNIRAADDRFDQANLVVVAHNGYVLIAGQVASEDLKAKATDVVRKIREVRRIYNELEVASPSSAMTRTSDSWITTKVKSWLLGSSSTPGLRVNVTTENGVVYLMGMVTEEEADRVAAVAADTSGVQRVVRLFELIES